MAQQYSWPSSSNVTLTGSTNGAPAPNNSVVVGGETDSGNVTPFRFEDDGDLKVAITGSVLPSGAATEAKQDDQITEAVAANALLTSIDGKVATEAKQDSLIALVTARLAGSLAPVAFDEVDLTYVTVGNGIGQVETAVYSLASTPVKTLTFTYDANDQLSNVIAS